MRSLIATLSLIFSLGISTTSITSADTVTIRYGGKPIIYDQVHVLGLGGGNLIFDGGNGPISKSFDSVVGLNLKDEQNLNAAESAYDAGKLGEAIEKYEREITQTAKPWVAEYCVAKEIDSWIRQGRFDKSVETFIRLAKLNSDLTANHTPALPDKDSKYLASAADMLSAAADSRDLPANKQDIVLGLLLEIQDARKDDAAFVEVAAKYFHKTPEEVAATTRPTTRSSLTLMAPDQLKRSAAIDAAKKAYDEAVYAADKEYRLVLDSRINNAKSFGPQGLLELRRLRIERAAIDAEMQTIHRDSNVEQVSELFTHDTAAKSIVYICDGSGSMIGGKDEEARIAILGAIKRLDPSQSFNALIFHESANKQKFDSVAKELLTGDDENKKTATNCIVNTWTFHGITNPLPALREALREQPQLIYLISDGGFEDNDPDEKSDIKTVMIALSLLNDKKAVQINTILVADRESEIDKDAEGRMKIIAGENNGVYTRLIAVPGKQK